MARIATRNGKPAHLGAAPRLRASDLDPRELPEWLQREADTRRWPMGRDARELAKLALLFPLVLLAWAIDTLFFRK